ncbi:MAG: putative spermidine/putrescine transport system permease protein [Gammaproteobacteria bacterium]|jgi:putative spermidine/putrescine transport system permease protein
MSSIAPTDPTSDIAPALTTADGMPLKASLARALRRNKLKALGLVAPLFIFLTISFVIPIADMLFRSVDNELVSKVLHRTVPELRKWDASSTTLPDAAVYAAIVEDFKEGRETRTIGRVGVRLNYEVSGMSSLFRKTARKAKGLVGPDFKSALIKLDKKWGALTTWQVIHRESDKLTPAYYLSALDLRLSPEGEIELQPENRQIYQTLFWRTLRLSLVITLLCLVLGYPISYLMATLPSKTSNLLMIMVLLPFWTSLLVRTTCWIALLQQQGVLNDLFVAIGLIDDNNRLEMIHNQVGTIIAMTHILLPFMVLPLFSVMKTIPPSYMRAARSLGATPLVAFVRVYMPNTVPGIGAGCILVFIIAIGYYITPELVGGVSGTLISNFIAYHMQSSLNWGLAAALGAILLAIVLVLYVLYDKIVGIDNMKFG